MVKSKRALSMVLIVSLGIWLCGCGDDDGHDYYLPPQGDPCAGGPVPCLTEDWGDAQPGATFYIFEDQYANPVFIFSDGVYGAGIAILDWKATGQLAVVAVGGPVVDCYNGQIQEAMIDFLPTDGITDWEGPASGNVNICKEILTTSNVVIDGWAYENLRAVYQGWDILSTTGSESGMLPEKELMMLRD